MFAFFGFFLTHWNMAFETIQKDFIIIEIDWQKNRIKFCQYIFFC